MPILTVHRTIRREDKELALERLVTLRRERDDIERNRMVGSPTTDDDEEYWDNLDPIAIHRRSVGILLACINDSEITKAFEALTPISGPDSIKLCYRS